eukprot:3858579-Amphidinium_carterae.1
MACKRAPILPDMLLRMVNLSAPSFGRALRCTPGAREDAPAKVSQPKATIASLKQLLEQLLCLTFGDRPAPRTHAMSTVLQVMMRTSDHDTTYAHPILFILIMDIGGLVGVHISGSFSSSRS